MRSTDHRDTGPCGFPRARLIAFHDGTLRGAQLEITQTHVAACEGCSAFLHELKQVDRLLRSATPLHDDLEARAAIKARVAAMPLPSPPRNRRSLLGRGRVALAVVALLGVVVMSVSVPGGIEGGSSFTRLFSDERVPRTSRPIGEEIGTPIILPAATIGAVELPLALAPSGEATGDDRFIEQGFRAPNGLAVMVSVDRTGEAIHYVPQDNDRQRIVAASGREVLVGVYGDDEWVTYLKWFKDDALFQVLILEQPPGGLRMPAAIELAEGVMSSWRPGSSDEGE